MLNITEDELKEIIKYCYTKADLCRKLGLKPYGGNYRIIDNLIKKYNIIWDNYLGVHFKKGKHVKGYTHKTIEEICVKNSDITNTRHLKMRLIREGYKPNYCEKCGYSLKVELHHINGNPCDNRLENLQILCPNCHAQTDNFRGKNIKNINRQRKCHLSLIESELSSEEVEDRNNQRKIKKRKNKEKIIYIKEDRYCCNCGKLLEGKQYRNKYCSVECYRDSNKGVRPTFMELINSFIELNSFLQVGKKYNVTDNAVRKWCKLYSIPIHKADLDLFLKPFKILYK